MLSISELNPLQKRLFPLACPVVVLLCSACSLLETTIDSLDRSVPVRKPVLENLCVTSEKKLFSSTSKSGRICPELGVSAKGGTFNLYDAGDWRIKARWEVRCTDSGAKLSGINGGMGEQEFADRFCEEGSLEAMGYVE